MFKYGAAGPRAIGPCVAIAVLVLAHVTNGAEAAKRHGRIVIDASKDGGVWWFPQGPRHFKPAKAHQGKALADYIRSRGWEVSELGRDQQVGQQLAGAALVIRANLFGQYKDAEVHAYRDYLSAGGNLLLLQGFVRDGQEKDDRVAQEFGITFSQVVKSAQIARWAEYPLTKELPLIGYNTGSIISDSPQSMTPIAYLAGDQVVMGIVKHGKGKFFASSSILPLLAVPQPFTRRLLDELVTKDAASLNEPSRPN